MKNINRNSKAVIFETKISKSDYFFIVFMSSLLFLALQVPVLVEKYSIIEIIAYESFLIIILTLSSYFLILIGIFKFIFYEDSFVILFPFRLNNSTLKINYDEINTVKFQQFMIWNDNLGGFVGPFSLKLIIVFNNDSILFKRMFDWSINENDERIIIDILEKKSIKYYYQYKDKIKKTQKSEWIEMNNK